MNLRYDTDMAVELKGEKEFETPYEFHEIDKEYCHIEIIQLLEDDPIYHKKKGHYISIQFDDLENENTFQEVKAVFITILQELTKSIKSKKILICGLGNSDLACDRLGPLLKNKIKLDTIGTTFLLIPGVKGQTGIETFDLIHAYIKENPVDCVILVDALATRSVERMNHVIQITDTGLSPGSGIGNHCHEISQDSLGIPVISLGVPTVVRLINIALDVLKQHDVSINEDILEEMNLHQIVMDKGCDLEVEKLSNLIAATLNELINENE